VVRILLYCLAVGLTMVYFESCNNDKQTSVVEEYYPDGCIKSQITIKNGLRNGIAKNYDNRGRLISTAEYLNDKNEGWLINYNSDNGKIAIKAHYKDDEQDGQVFQYYREGMLFRESFYIKGRVNGMIKTYWPNGNLKAENTFKMGQAAIGLKEYRENGEVLKQPVIVVQEINQAALLSKVIVKIFLSDGNKNVEFFKEELEEGKYFIPDYSKYWTENGVAIIEYQVNRGHTLIEKLKIVAKAKTEFNNTLILYRTYNLAVIN
jgi:hypothetical protein